MDKKQQQAKSHGAGRLSAAEQQQLAMFQQLGALDPSLMGYGLPGMDPQQLLNPMAAGGYPFMNSAALQAFAGLGGLGGQSGAGAAEWWNLAQNQALAASLGAGYFPGMIPGFPVVPGGVSQDSKSPSTQGSSKLKDEKKKYDKISPRLDTSSPSTSRLHHDRKSSHESMSSTNKERPDSHHSTSSPFRPGGSKQNDSNASSWLDGINNQRQQKLNEQVLQAELMRQFEQQLMLQQLQQQQQDQINAALQSVLTAGNLPGSSSGSQKKNSSEAEKMQDQLTAMMMASGMQGMTPAMAASLFSTPGALETMMAMSQMGGMTGLSGLGNAQNLQQDSRSKSSPSTSQWNSTLHSPQRTQKYRESSASPSKFKKREQSSSPSKTQQLKPDSSKNPMLVPIPGIPGPGLPADEAWLATLYSQYLQYEEMMKQQAGTSKKGQDNGSQQESKSKSSTKDESPHTSSKYNNSLHNDVLSSLNRTNLHSPANSTSSSRGKSHVSPVREISNSPSQKLREPARSQSRGSSTKYQSSSSKPSTSRNYAQENMSETLKLFSKLASNPNLTQQDLATLLSFPPTMDPTALLAGMGPSTSALLNPSLASQMSPAEMEKLNKNLAIALTLEQQKLNEQVNRQIQMESSKKGKENDNHISVIHQNNLKSDWERPSSSHSLGEKVRGKRSSGDSKNEGTRFGNGDAASSDGDMRSETSGDKNSSTGKYKRRRVITDEDEVMEPIKHGWKREIRFKLIGNQLRGEVIYIAPGGKKLRTFPDVLKHLEDNNIAQLSRNNFSFSSKLRIGSFFEQKEKDKGSRQWHEISEEELDQRIRHLDRGRSASPYTDNLDQISNSSSSKGESKSGKKDKEKEKERQLEQLRLLKEQEELRRLEQQRIEREIRERIALEELERQRVEEARQQMILMRALEARKRAEERERRKEEQRIEKMIQRERKMEQRRIAMQIARELKMPVEDMATVGAPDLPELTRLQGTYDNKCPHQLSGNTCADLLMVLEFVKTFKDCIRLDDSTIPSFEQLQLGLLNDPKHTPALVKLTMALLHQCLCDPGVPAPGPWLHCLTGVKVTDIDVSDDNYSEILRLFIWARSGYKTEIAIRLETLPFLSLTTDEKATSLAFLVNELVCSRPICMEIEKNLDTMATLRRDKWMVEGQIRQLRIAYEKNPGTDSPIIKMEDDENSSNSFSSKAAVAGEQIKEEPAEETSESLFQKKMEELTQQHNSYNTQLAHSTKPLRALDLGQDRYKRRYWVLPNLGGVYVEGLESGISYEDDDESPDEDEDEEEEELKNIENGTHNPSAHSKPDVKSEEPKGDVKEIQSMNGGSVKTEHMEVTSDAKESSMNETENRDSIAKNDNQSAISVNGPSSAGNDQPPLGNNRELIETSNNTVENGRDNTDDIPVSKSDSSARICDSRDIVTNSNTNVNMDVDEKETVAKIHTGTNEIGHQFKSNPDTLQNSTIEPCENTPKLNSPLPKLDKAPDVSDGSHVSKTSSSPSKALGKTHLPKPGEEDTVMAAAKAIAAKAVASSSHLLFPGGSPTRSKFKKESSISPEKQKDKKPQYLEGANSTLPIGEHTINALVQIGVNPTSLTSQQLEVLSHLDIPMSLPSKMEVSPQKTADSYSKSDKLSKEAASNKESPSRASSDKVVEDDEKDKLRKKSQDQDIPMDLSRPVAAKSPNDPKPLAPSSSPSPSKSFPIKVELPSQRDSPFMPVRDSPDPKFIDNKFFVPISFNNGDAKLEQQQYNQVISSCPSPNTLANYIVSSVNYGQFPSLDEIKFPIRAPDVKEEPDVIPRERKRGWWRIESEVELRNLSEKLHLRGIREKQLHRNITKNFEICTNSMTDSTLPEHQFTILTKDSLPGKDSPKESTEKLTDVEKLRKSTRSSSQERNFANIPSRFTTEEASAFESEMQVLRQVEELAAKSVTMGVVSPQWKATNATPSVNRMDLTHVPLGPLRDELNVEIKFDIVNPIYHDPRSALGAAVELVGCLERAVCRRYLKPPLVRKGGATEFSSLPSLSESGVMDVAAGLRTWRNAVASSSSASQLALCVRMLEACIAWDRSANSTPTKVETSPVIKTKKRKPDKRSGPKSSSAPDSPIQQAKKRRKKRTTPPKSSESKKAKRMPIDTADVISKSVPTSVEEVTLTNGTEYSDTLENEIPENSFDDSIMSNDIHEEHSQRNGPAIGELQDVSSSQYHTNSDNVSEEYRPSAEPKKKKKKKKKMKLDSKDETNKKSSKPKKRADKDTIVCRGVLKELQSHEDATWFLFPVDCKLVPGYRKIIKKPIDFHTIESRLKRGRYKSKDEFVSEVRLVFDNCQKFNEDDSNIGRAGHQIRGFFERRWAEVLREKYGETAIVPVPEPQPAFVPDIEEESNSVPGPDPLMEPMLYTDSESGLVIDDS